MTLVFPEKPHSDAALKKMREPDPWADICRAIDDVKEKLPEGVRILTLPDGQTVFPLYDGADGGLQPQVCVCLTTGKRNVNARFQPDATPETVTDRILAAAKELS